MNVAGGPAPDPLQRAATGVGLATAASGAALMLAPRLALRILGAGRDEPAPFLFRVVGMFMAVTGGALADVSRSDDPSPVALRWAMATKLGAAAMVTTGVRTKRFGKQAALLALIDAGSAGLIGAILAKRSR